MTASYRIFVLFLTCAVTAVLFRLVMDLGFTYETCGIGVPALFFEDDWLSPFQSYSFIFLLMSIWALSEWFVCWEENRLMSLRSAALASITLLLTVNGLMLYTGYEAKKKLEQKDPNYEFVISLLPDPSYVDPLDQFVNWRKRQWLLWREHHPEGLPGFHAYVWEQTCAKGIDIGLLSEDEWRKIDAAHDQMWESHYSHENYLMAKEGLYKFYGVEHDCSVDGCPDWYRENRD